MKIKIELWLLFILMGFIVYYLPSCSNFGVSCPDEEEEVSVIDETTFDWFEVYEQLDLFQFEDRRFNQLSDTTLLRVDTFEALPEFRFIEDRGCFDHCPSICQLIDAGVAQVNISAFGASGANVISITTQSGFPFDNSYTLRIDANGELIDSLDIFDVQDSNFGDRFTVAEQWERDRVTLSRFRELEFDGNIYRNCFEIKDSTPINPPGYYRYTFIYCQKEGPILFETYKIVNNPAFPNPLITANSLKQIN